MAGIGFDLKKLFVEENSANPKIDVAVKSAFITSGPWLSSVLFLAAVKLFIQDIMSKQEFDTFMSIAIYGFVFSMAISSSISYMSTRKLADILYIKDYQAVVRLFLESSFVLAIFSFLLCLLYLILFTNLQSHWYLICSFFALMCVMWQVMIFVSSMKDFNTVFFSFIFGLVLSFVALFFYGYHGAYEAISSFSFGISVTIGLLLNVLIKEFGYKPQKLNFAWLKEKDLYALFASGFLFYAAMWADKLIYWFDSEFKIEVIKGFFFFPAYDLAIFIAYLTMIPTVAYFSVFVETYFYEEQKSYLSSIENKKDLWHIKSSAENLFVAFLKSVFNVTIFQFLIAIASIVLLTYFFDFLNIAPESIPLLRISLFCAMAQIVLQVIIIFIYYFDFQKEALFITLFAFIANLFFTILLKDYGFEYVGYSYFASLLLSIIFALAISFYKFKRINYYIFMGSEVL